jgi:uncharacterized damage-inducible protein DinB
MNLQEILKIFDYNYWANERLLEAAKPISNQEFTAPAPFPFGGLRGTLVHVFDAEYSWRMLLQNGILAGEMPETDFATPDDLAMKWHEEQAAFRLYLAGMHEDDFKKLIRYTSSAGVPRERVLWHCLFHLVNHGTQHRGEAAAILTSLGHSPGDLDFVVFLNELQ